MVEAQILALKKEMIKKRFLLAKQKVDSVVLKD